ncbi:DNA-binding transcriptional LysR family regulator [Rhizobium azooxidifex]|uniref:DNA-binding transcriptional LysR family regulator n=1 Tax=Mycoplana azooxidifex TaxID=1636188 RepID=A0A7W6DC99_9HYPH|nr:LysR family transcriptional regulator [Mycoplana azooxidifex]MBB3978075.1 DNA-binding transcriptional LysR family regulator [Mycoplana azooxidifex]
MTSNRCADKTGKSTQLDKAGFAMDQFRLDSLDVFAAIVRCGGFRAAAQERGVSSSALSQTINSLEEALGIRLLNRTTRSVAPTEAGERLLRRLGPALTDIRLAVDDLNQLKDNPSGTLRINAPGPAIDHLLCPAMFTFMDTYPDIKVELVSDAAVIDIVEQGFDAGVRFGKQLAQDMIAVPLGPSLRYAIVASPDYIAKHGLPLTPNDLARHNCIRRRFPGGMLVSWKFEKGGDTLDVLPEGRLTLSSAHNELQAAVAGCGLAHVFEDYATHHLTSGRLTEVLKDWSPLLPSWYLYYPSKRHSSAAMRVLVSFLRSHDWNMSQMPA